jgi:hypothetical protein
VKREDGRAADGFQYDVSAACAPATIPPLMGCRDL